MPISGGVSLHRSCSGCAASSLNTGAPIVRRRWCSGLPGQASIPRRTSNTSRRSTDKWPGLSANLASGSLISTLPSAIAVIRPQEPSLFCECFRQSHLKALQLLLGEERPLLPATTRAGNDQRVARQSLNPDALRTSYEQP